MNTINQEYSNLNLEFDRIVSDSIQLNNQYEDIQISANELAINDTLNIKIGKLYENFLQMYGLTKLTNNNILGNYAGSFGNYNNQLQWSSSTVNTSGARINVNIGLPDLDNITVWESISASKYNNGILNVMSDGTSLIFLQTDFNNTTVTPILSTQKSNDLSNYLYTNISDIAIDNSNNLLVLDSGQNNLYLYDISGFFNNDNVKHNTRYLKNVIGGFGDKYGKNKFNNPVAIESVNGINFVLDSGNDCIKIYDKDLNWLDTVIFKNLFIDYPPIDFYIDSNFKCYIITSNSYILVIDLTTKTHISTIDYTTLLGVGETFKRIKGSDFNDNVYYVLTNFNIIKRYKSRDDAEIGRFFPNNSQYITATQLQEINIIGTVGYDNIGCFCLNEINAGVFLNFNETNNLISILDNDDFQIYTLNDIKIQREEYSQYWVFNKTILKLYNDHILLLNQIKKQFTFYWDGYNNLYFESLGYVTVYDTIRNDVQLNYNYFMGMNENFQSDVMNRCLGSIWKLQKVILGLIIGNIPTNLNAIDISGGLGSEFVKLDCSGCGIIAIKTGINIYTIDNTKILGQISCQNINLPSTNCAVISILSGEQIYSIANNYPITPIIC